MVNYQDGKIYKLVGGGLTYYGSTCNELYKRFHQHKKKSNCAKSKQLFDTGDKVDIVLVEKYPCNDKMELHKRERYYIENNECINKAIPTRTIKEWKKDNKDKIKEKNKEYIEKNKDKIKGIKKEYYKTNKDKINERNKKYFETNKDKIKSEKITCDCGSVIRKYDISIHNKSKKHIQFINK
jgi:hypothetical protein